MGLNNLKFLKMLIAILYYENNVVLIRSVDRVEEIKTYLNKRGSMKESCSLVIQSLDTNVSVQMDNIVFDAFLADDSLPLFSDIQREFGKNK